MKIFTGALLAALICIPAFAQKDADARLQAATENLGRLELFAIGLAINGISAIQPAPWWETIAWSILALLFAVQTVIYGIAGLRYGWDTPLEEREKDE